MGGDTLTGRTLGGKYRLIRCIGKGGMGSVYQGVHTELEKKVAVKLLHQQMAPHQDVFQRFKREAKIACKLNHPNIIEVFDFDRTPDGIPYIVMEFLAGEDLEALLDRRGSLPMPRVLSIFEGICSAVQAAHDEGVVHRDLKPQNILLCKVGDRPEVPKVLDFGISKLRDHSSIVTQTKAYLGTPCFMAPEQARGDAADATARSDIFALGAILYRMVSGRMAFAGSSVEAVLYKIIHEQPEPLHKLCPDLPRAVARVVHQAMAKDPALRHASARKMWEALAKAAGEPAEEGPAPQLQIVEEHGSGPDPSVIQLGTEDRKGPAPTRGYEERAQAAPAAGETAATVSQPAAREGAAATGISTLSSSMGEQYGKMTRPREGSRWLYGVAGLAVLLVAGALIGRSYMLRYGSGGDDAPPAAEPAAASAPATGAEPPPPATPPRVQVELLNLVQGATVTLDGEVVTENPFSIPRTERKHRLEVKAPDGRTFAHEVSALRDLTVAVAMPAAPPKQVKARKRPRPRPRPAPAPEPTPVTKPAPAPSPAPTPTKKTAPTQEEYGEGTMPMELK